MSVRPNIQSVTIEGTDLVIRGETDDPLPNVLRVVVAQGEASEDGLGVKSEDAPAKKIVAGWTARIEKTNLKKGPAQTVGIEVRVKPLEVRTWFQALEIE